MSFKRIYCAGACATAALLSFAALPAIAADAAAPSRVMVAQRVIDSAAAYQGFVSRAGAIKADFASGEGVRSALYTAAAYQQDQLQEGAIAYAALAALQDAKFVNSVRGYAGFPGAGDRLTERLAASPDAIFDLPEAEAAALRISAVLRDQGDRVVSAGKAVKQSAYDVQRQAWSNQAVGDGQARLIKVKAMSATRSTANQDDASRLIAAITDKSQANPDGARVAQITKTTARGLAIASLAVMGKAGEDNDFALASLLSQPGDGQCLKMAKLNLFQCLAVAGPQYEDIFCLGEHALKETGQCVTAAAGAPRAVGPKPMAALDAPKPNSQAVFVPVADTPIQVAAAN